MAESLNTSGCDKCGSIPYLEKRAISPVRGHRRWEVFCSECGTVWDTQWDDAGPESPQTIDAAIAKLEDVIEWLKTQRDE